MMLLALVNLRGVGESVKFNVVLTLVEMSGAVDRHRRRDLRDVAGQRGPGRVVVFDSASDKGMFLAVTAATAIAFFAMVGFEDSVNMVEETQGPRADFPKMMLTGLGIAVMFYVLVAISVVAAHPGGRHDRPATRRARRCSRWSSAGAPGFPIDKIFPFLAVFAVANTALINMLMASRLLYGMANQGVLPTPARQGATRPSYAVGGDHLLHAPRPRPDHLRVSRRPREHAVVTSGGTTALLLLCVFAVVNVACMVLRRDTTSPTPLQVARRPPVVGAVPVLPRRPVGPRRGRGAVQDRARPPGARRRAVGDHLDRPSRRRRRQPSSTTSTTSRGALGAPAGHGRVRGRAAGRRARVRLTGRFPTWPPCTPSAPRSSRRTPTRRPSTPPWRGCARCRRWSSPASATSSRPSSPRSPAARRSCSRAATAPRPSTASPPTTSATSCGCCCRWRWC